MRRKAHPLVAGESGLRYLPVHNGAMGTLVPSALTEDYILKLSEIACMLRNPLPSVISVKQNHKQWRGLGWGWKNASSTSIKRCVSRFFQNEKRVVKVE